MNRAASPGGTVRANESARPDRPEVGAESRAGVVVVAARLVYEQSLVRADDLSQVKRAFDLNGYVGILYLIVLTVSLYGR